MKEKRYTLTVLLREALRTCPKSFVEIEEETGVSRISMSLFMRELQSLRLDKADTLAGYFGITHTRTSKAKKGDR